MISTMIFLLALGQSNVPRAWASSVEVKRAMKRPAGLQARRIFAPKQGPPPASAPNKGLRFVTGDSKSYWIDAGGQIALVADSPDPDKAVLKRILGDVEEAWARHDFDATRALVAKVPARIRRMVFDPATFFLIESTYYERGALAADETGNAQTTAGWLADFYARYECPSYRPLYAAALLRLGSQDPGLLDYVQSLNREAQPYPGLPSALPPQPSPLLVAECAAGWEMRNVSWPLAEAHALRALKIDPRQAASALVLGPYYIRLGRYAEAARIDRAALPYARGESLRIVEVDLRDAERLLGHR